MKSFLVILGILLGMVIVVGSVWVVQYYTAPVRGTIGAYEQIQSGPMRIASYNYFFDLYAAIQSYTGSLTALQEELDQVQTPSERERILSTIAGLKGQRARAIAQYNADAQKDYTIGQFRSWSLPYHLEEK